MKKLALGLILAGVALTGRPAWAEIGTVDAVPAATLLLPYFEVDLNNASGITTLLSINNASASAGLAHVTLWTDQSIPTLNFDLYLTGYDVHTINLRDIFNGNVPVTASVGQDPTDTISPQGPVSQDINFASCTGTLPYVNPELSASIVAHIRAAHTGQNSAVLGGCAGNNYGDAIARGYLTVDSVTACNVQFPSDPTYFSAIADQRNVLWGDYIYANPGENFAQGDMLVHVEACQAGGSYVGSVGNGAGHCPFSAGDYTFYGRYAAVAGLDHREPLATTFASRFLNGGTFSGGTDFVVWRDSKTVPTGVNGAHSCVSNPAWFPLQQTDVVAFDERENATDICSASNCFPLESARVSAAGLPYLFGWVYANLNHAGVSATLPAGVAQAWVTPVMDAAGRFSVGFHGIPLDSALTAPAGGVILIP